MAAPLIARSGVYNSTIELVTAARARGLEWTALVGVSRNAAGSPTKAPGVHEFEAEPSGVRGIRSLSHRLRATPEFMNADLVITMVPQSDMALALTRRPWVAYLRGLPWPAAGEGSPLKRALWRTIERTALRRAREVWATTRILAAETGGEVDRLVAPGLVPPATTFPESGPRAHDIVWAARFSEDKNPVLFLQAMAGADAHGAMYGTGPLEEQVRGQAPTNVEVRGWRAREEIWESARAYVGTSSREAFGRSAVEAAMLGIPVILSDVFGCADMLYTDASLREALVLGTADTARWREAISRLTSDDEFHTRASAHLRENAARLTIESAVDNVVAASAEVIHGHSSAQAPS
ncbi:glycosyltransferase family 4 protein [Microbacterium enclense]|uniref:glycosyltransferase family 4 protein n=1 Tax=Microbacterium enclense TaxID=993073 RepID=UPI0021A9136C|nr:glycosyltransferase family 4 protein [Microbacterium enclense]MCT2085760.1 glycosyltransferase family 4 protein [Microbacterium enclense]